MGKLLVIMLFAMFMLFQSIEALDYKDALEKAILFFEGQRSGKLPEQRVKWRGDSGLTDGELDNVNLVGGYYYAGDNVKFLWPMSFTTTLLSWAAIEYQSEISSAGQLDYLMSAIKWGTDFILLAHASPNMLYTQVGDANADHLCWQRPEDMDTPRTLYNITPESAGSEVAGEAAAALAAASIVFKGPNSTYSSILLEDAKTLFEFASKQGDSTSDLTSCPFYCSYSGHMDELLWAAAWLYKATGDNNYLTYAIMNKVHSHDVSEFSWENKFVGAQALFASEFLNGPNDSLKEFKNDVESYICALMPRSSSQQIKLTSGGLLFTRDVINFQYVTTAATIMFQYSKTLLKTGNNYILCGSIQISVSEIQKFAKLQVDYILGNNPMDMSYMVGFGTNFPKRLHHRGASLPSIQSHSEYINCRTGFDDYFNQNLLNLNEHTGAIVGGPNSSDQFNDTISNLNQTEPATYINAAFIGPVAALIGMNLS